MDVPLNTPIYLKAHNGRILTNKGAGYFAYQSSQVSFQTIQLIRTADNKIVIQSKSNGKSLQVRKSGYCVFANRNQLLWEKFDIEKDQSGKIYFISCHTGNVMRIDGKGFARCINMNRAKWSALTIDPEPRFDIPLNTPICLKAYTGNHLTNEGSGRCINKNMHDAELVQLKQTTDNKIIIQSISNGNNLQVRVSGYCVFANQNQKRWEKFDVEQDQDGKIYFISCHTGNVMQCNPQGFARCNNRNRLEWEAWTIVNPTNVKIPSNIPPTKSTSVKFPPPENHPAKSPLPEAPPPPSKSPANCSGICNNLNFLDALNRAFKVFGVAARHKFSKFMKIGWRLIYAKIMSYLKLMFTDPKFRIITFTVLGAALIPLLGLTAGALVPVAMSTFGTVVAGVGTFHAPFIAGGCAAILQVASASLLTFGAASAGGALGAFIAFLFNACKKENANDGHQQAQ